VKNSFLFSLILLACACNSYSSAMSRQQYDDVLLGASISDLMCLLGEPYSVRCLCDGVEEYQYIERVSQNDELAYENHYFIKVVNGQVVSKRMKVESRPAYDLIYEADPNYPNYPPY